MKKLALATAVFMGSVMIMPVAMADNYWDQPRFVENPARHTTMRQIHHERQMARHIHRQEMRKMRHERRMMRQKMRHERRVARHAYHQPPFVIR